MFDEETVYKIDKKFINLLIKKPNKKIKIRFVGYCNKIYVMNNLKKNEISFYLENLTLIQEPISSFQYMQHVYMENFSIHQFLCQIFSLLTKNKKDEYNFAFYAKPSNILYKSKSVTILEVDKDLEIYPDWYI